MLAHARLQTLVWTADVATAATFYADVLGLTETGRSDGAVVFDVGGSDLRISPVPATRPSEHTVVGFAVADLDGTLAALRARGIALERFAHVSQDPAGVLRTPDGARVAWFRDPDGNLLSVVDFAAQPRSDAAECDREPPQPADGTRLDP